MASLSLVPCLGHAAAPFTPERGSLAFDAALRLIGQAVSPLAAQVENVFDFFGASNGEDGV